MYSGIEILDGNNSRNLSFNVNPWLEIGPERVALWRHEIVCRYMLAFWGLKRGRKQLSDIGLTLGSYEGSALRADLLASYTTRVLGYRVF